DGPEHPERDWNDDNPQRDPPLSALAERFCRTIRHAAPNGFTFGLTSGCRYPTNHRHIPWPEFVTHSGALYPQVYWYGDHGPQHGGTPDEAFGRAQDSWSTIAHGKPIIPIIGHISSIQATEISRFGDILQANNIPEVHFYTCSESVPQGNLDAMRSL